MAQILYNTCRNQFSNIMIKNISLNFAYFLFVIFFSISSLKSQDFKAEIELLKVDTQYALFQYHSNNTAKRFKELFDKSKDQRAVFFHYGASHIQAEIVTTRAKEYLHQQFGNAGYGFLFPFSAAKTYSSINYKTSHFGNWSYAKSYQLPPKIPLGARGMTVETTDTFAGFSLIFNEKTPSDIYDLIVFFDNNEQTPNFEIRSGNFVYVVNDSILSELKGQNHIVLTLHQSLEDLNLNILPLKKEGQLFRFYGFSLEKKEKKGFLYQSLGVGASPFEAVLHLEKLKEQAKLLKPNMVMLDYGTNNILYNNSVPANLSDNVAKAIKIFRDINPEIIIVLTSTQDLFYKGRYIDAAVVFNKLMDSLALVHDCMYWNFYDLSGGFAQIKNWQEQGYAQKDHIHLTHSGYKLKGYLLYRSIANTLDYISNNILETSLAIPVKNYDTLIELNKVPIIETRQPKSKSKSKTYLVKPGDTLSEISRKFGISVKRLKSLNKLKGDLIRIGQVIKVK
jgi:LysM repeat protein